MLAYAAGAWGGLEGENKYKKVVYGNELKLETLKLWNEMHFSLPTNPVLFIHDFLDTQLIVLTLLKRTTTIPQDSI